MNKVSQRCEKDSCAKFLFASNRMYGELKCIKIGLYLLNIIPVIICFLPATDTQLKLLCSVISFGLTLVNEVATSFLNNHKEKAILQHQLYESEITGSSFSKIEYDRESTNDLNELAIRKGLPGMKKAETYPISDVPQVITDDYSYLYLCRKSAATYRYLLSRMFYVYAFVLVAIGLAFIGATFTNTSTAETLYLLVCFWPLIIPFIRNCAACKKCMRQCVKICADIDNFFADGDGSVERLARFYYYVQNIEFEMLLTRPAVYRIFQKVFSHGVFILTDGVTERFKDAIVELKGKTLMAKGLISQPKGKALITKVDYDLEALNKMVREKKAKLVLSSNVKLASKSSSSTATSKTVTQAKTTASKTVAQPKVTASKTVVQPKATASKTVVQPKATASKTVVQPKATASKTVVQPKATASKTVVQPKATASKTVAQPKTTASKTVAQPKATASKTVAQAKTTTSKTVAQAKTAAPSKEVAQPKKTTSKAKEEVSKSTTKVAK